jgi:hypothetical protein
MSNTIDSLIYTSIKNNITINDPDDRFFFLKKSTGTNSITDNTIANNKINELLTQTTIKRACCMAKRDSSKVDADNNITVNVKIPIPTGSASSTDKVGTKFGFKNVSVKVPKSACTRPEIFGEAYNTSDSSKLGNPQCDNFIGGYCSNMKYLYKLENGNNPFDPNEFSQYAPECPCYADLPIWAAQKDSSLPNGIPKICALTNCEQGNNDAYLDQSSRDGCKSNITFCTEYNNWKSLNATQGGTINIDKKTVQNCGVDSAPVNASGTTASTASTASMASAASAASTASTVPILHGTNISADNVPGLIVPTGTPTKKSSTDPSGVKTETLTYPDGNKIISKIDPSGNGIITTLDTSGKKVAEYDLSGKKITKISEKTTESTTSTATDELSNTMIYVGVGVGVFVLIIIIAVVFFMYKKNQIKIK